MPVLHKIPWLGKKLFTSTGIIERKTDLIIQITPKIVVDAYTGITKSDEMQKYEDYVIYGTPSDTSASASDDEHELNESDDEPDSEEGE